jgi:hypothetical protein
MSAHRRSPRRPAGRRCSSARLAGAGCPPADRYRRRRPHSVLRFRVHPVANAGLCRAGDLQPGAAVRDRGPRLRKPDRAAARLPPSVRCRTGRLPAQRPAGGAAAPAGIGGGRWQKFLTVAAMAGLVTAVLVGSAAGLLAAVVSDHSLIAVLIAGVLVAIAVFAAPITSRSRPGGGRRRSCSTTSKREPQGHRPIRARSLYNAVASVRVCAG